MAKNKDNKTIVNFILDKSGSMTSVQDSTISGFNEYISTLKKDKKNQYEFTLVLFDTQVVKPVYEADIKEVDDLDRKSYVPSGLTALYDAVCTTIRGVKEKKGQKVINVIMTDGEENSSKEYTQVQMKTLIEEREKKGNWTFVYLGANQDSYTVAQKYGILQGNITNFYASAAGVSATFTAMANNTRNFAGNDTLSTANFFSKEDQETLGNTK